MRSTSTNRCEQLQLSFRVSIKNVRGGIRKRSCGDISSRPRTAQRHGHQYRTIRAQCHSRARSLARSTPRWRAPGRPSSSSSDLRKRVSRQTRAHGATHSSRRPYAPRCTPRSDTPPGCSRRSSRSRAGTRARSRRASPRGTASSRGRCPASYLGWASARARAQRRTGARTREAEVEDDGLPHVSARTCQRKRKD